MAEGRQGGVIHLLTVSSTSIQMFHENPEEGNLSSLRNMESGEFMEFLHAFK
jgi:hypothetical protein